MLGSLVNGQLLTMAALLAIQLFLNVAGIRIVALLNDASVWWHIGTVAVIVVALFLIASGKTHADISPFTIQPLDTTGSASPLGLQPGPGRRLCHPDRVPLLAAAGPVDLHGL